MHNSKHISNMMTSCTWKKGKAYLPKIRIFYLCKSIHCVTWKFTNFDVNIIRWSKPMPIIGRLGL